MHFLPATLSCNLNTIIIDTPFDAFLLVAFALNCHSPHGLTYRSAFSCYGCSCRLVLALSVLTSPDARRNQSASESTARQRSTSPVGDQGKFYNCLPLTPLYFLHFNSFCVSRRLRGKRKERGSSLSRDREEVWRSGR